MYQLDLPLNQNDDKLKASILETMDVMIQAMGFGSLSSCIDMFSTAFKFSDEMEAESRRNAKRRQIKRFNKRMKQKRSYCK